jgi:hypothetical protein
MTITRHPPKIPSLKIAPKCLLAQGTTAKLMPKATLGPERKELTPMARVQVQGVILILTSRIGTGSLIDTLLGAGRAKEKGAAAVLLVMVTDMIGLIGDTAATW